MPVLTDMPPAPEQLIEVSSCTCKTGCNTMRCKCKKNNMVCTEMCLCVECQNDDEEEDEVNNNPSWSEDEDDGESIDEEDAGLSGEDEQFRGKGKGFLNKFNIDEFAPFLCIISVPTCPIYIPSSQSIYTR